MPAAVSGRAALAKRGTPRRRPSATKNRENPQSLEVAPVHIAVEDLTAFNESINVLIHGPSGHGKTRLAGFTPNATFLSTEKGVVSAQRAGSKAKVIRAPQWEHVQAALDLADSEMGPEDWLIVDSLTKMQVLLVRWILRMQRESNENRDLDIPAIQDHQKWQNMFMRFVDRIVDARYNSVFITTSMMREDPEGEDIVLPQITGKDYAISSYVCAQMDVIGYYAISEKASTQEKVVRRCLFQPWPPYVAKDRFDVLGKYQDVEEGDTTAMPEFIDMIRNPGQ